MPRLRLRLSLSAKEGGAVGGAADDAEMTNPEDEKAQEMSNGDSLPQEQPQPREQPTQEQQPTQDQQEAGSAAGASLNAGDSSSHNGQSGGGVEGSAEGEEPEEGNLKVRFKLSASQQQQHQQQQSEGGDGDVEMVGGEDDDGRGDADSQDAGGEPLPLAKVLTLALRELMQLDRHNVFYDEVSDEVAPQYSEIISQPMAFINMQQKVRLGKYASLAEFQQDLELLCANAMTYNPDESIFYAEAKRMRREGLGIIARLSRRLSDKDKLAERRKSLGVAVNVSDAVEGGSMADAVAQEQAAVMAKASAAAAEQLGMEQPVALAAVVPSNIAKRGGAGTAVQSAEAVAANPGASTVLDNFVLYGSSAFKPLKPVEPLALDDQLAIEDVNAVHAASGASVGAEMYAQSLREFVQGLDEPIANESLQKFLDELTAPLEDVASAERAHVQNDQDIMRYTQEIADSSSADPTAPVPISRDLLEMAVSLEGDFSTPRGLTPDELKEVMKDQTVGLIDTPLLEALNPAGVATPASVDALPEVVTHRLLVHLAETQGKLDKNFQILCYLQMAQHSRAGDKQMALRERQQFDLMIQNVKSMAQDVPPAYWTSTENRQRLQESLCRQSRQFLAEQVLASRELPNAAQESGHARDVLFDLHQRIMGAPRVPPAPPSGVAATAQAPQVTQPVPARQSQPTPALSQQTT